MVKRAFSFYDNFNGRSNQPIRDELLCGTVGSKRHRSSLRRLKTSAVPITHPRTGHSRGPGARCSGLFENVIQRITTRTSLRCRSNYWRYPRIMFFRCRNPISRHLLPHSECITGFTPTTLARKRVFSLMDILPAFYGIVKTLFYV